MFEFIPFCPFSSNNLNQEEPLYNESLIKPLSETYQFDSIQPEPPSEQNITNVEGNKRQNSLNHNMVKQLIIAIKQMMNPHIRHLKNRSTGQLKKAVQDIWENFINYRHANKQLLKSMFDQHPSPTLLKKYGFNKVIEQHGIEIFKQGVQVIKVEMLYRMKNQSIKSHLLDRRVQNKERLQAFIIYFLHEQLQKGSIAYRQGQRATEKIEKILKKCKEQQVFIDTFFSSSSEEVIERFASLNNEIS